MENAGKNREVRRLDILPRDPGRSEPPQRSRFSPTRFRKRTPSVSPLTLAAPHDQIALPRPISWAASTHIDKYLVEKYFKDSDTAVVMVFTAIFCAIALPLIWLFEPSVQVDTAIGARVYGWP